MAKKTYEYTSKSYDNLIINVNGREIELQNPLNFSFNEEVIVNSNKDDFLKSNAQFSLIVPEPDDQKFLKELKDRVVIVNIMNAWKIWGDSEKEKNGVAEQKQVNLDVK